MEKHTLDIICKLKMLAEQNQKFLGFIEKILDNNYNEIDCNRDLGTSPTS